MVTRSVRRGLSIAERRRGIILLLIIQKEGIPFSGILIRPLGLLKKEGAVSDRVWEWVRLEEWRRRGYESTPSMKIEKDSRP